VKDASMTLNKNEWARPGANSSMKRFNTGSGEEVKTCDGVVLQVNQVLQGEKKSNREEGVKLWEFHQGKSREEDRKEGYRKQGGIKVGKRLTWL